MNQFPNKDYYIRWLEKQVKKLEKERNELRKKLNAVNMKRYKEEQDYLPYEDRYEY